MTTYMADYSVHGFEKMFMHQAIEMKYITSQSSSWHFSAKIEFSIIAACDSVFTEMMYRCA